MTHLSDQVEVAFGSVGARVAVPLAVAAKGRVNCEFCAVGDTLYLRILQV